MVKNDVPSYKNNEERRIKLQQKYIYIQKIIASDKDKKKLQVKQ